MIRLATVHADKKGRIRQLVTTPPAPAGEADVVLMGPAGNDDLVRMVPVKVAVRHQHGGRILSFLRNCGRD